MVVHALGSAGENPKPHRYITHGCQVAFKLYRNLLKLILSLMLVCIRMCVGAHISDHKGVLYGTKLY